MSMKSTSLYESCSLSAVLAAELLNAGHDLRVRVTGCSMRPFLKDGDMVTIRKAPVTALRAGDVLLCKCDDDTLIMHRLLKMQHNGLILYTKGDALDRMDPPLTGGQCLGRAIAVERETPPGIVLTDMMSFKSVTTNCLRARYFRFRVIMVGMSAALKRLWVG